jgi:hypothetical protein
MSDERDIMICIFDQTFLISREVKLQVLNQS